MFTFTENRNAAPGHITAVAVPSTGPGGQVHVTVVNPGGYKYFLHFSQVQN